MHRGNKNNSEVQNPKITCSVGKSETQQVFVRRWTFMGVLDDGAQL